jgi:hypothetical protein
VRPKFVLLFLRYEFEIVVVLLKLVVMAIDEGLVNSVVSRRTSISSPASAPSTSKSLGISAYSLLHLRLVLTFLPPRPMLVSPSGFRGVRDRKFHAMRDIHKLAKRLGKFV